MKHNWTKIFEDKCCAIRIETKEQYLSLIDEFNNNFKDSLRELHEKDPQIKSIFERYPNRPKFEFNMKLWEDYKDEKDLAISFYYLSFIYGDNIPYYNIVEYNDIILD